MDKGNEMQSIIDSNEPEPDDGEAYQQYIRERYKPGFVEIIEGEVDLYYESMEYKLAASISSLLDDKQRGFKNKILKILETTGSQQINFGDMGRISYLPNKNDDRTLRVDTKPIFPIKEVAENEYAKINFNLK
jgi:hypothetical protein